MIFYLNRIFIGLLSIGFVICEQEVVFLGFLGESVWNYGDK